MTIFPLPQFEADLEAARRDAEDYERLSVPKTLVVRFGLMRIIGEFPWESSSKPGCGSKIVVRTHRGTELGEMLTSTCPNAGCSKSVSRQEMLEYIENSGGKDYPFVTEGRAMRVASIEDMNHHARLEAQRPAMLKAARQWVERLLLPMKIVDAEPILGGERITFYFASEERVDFRELVHELARDFSTRIELRQVGARDEARLVADYEKCGQHCCCRQFLKVLKPVSIKSAKTQKATLDPLKISGRCGRLMCCLRYEDQTYEDLVKRLPKMKKRVGTPHGVGMVVDRQILTQLVLVKLEHDMSEVAVPVEELCVPEEAPPAPERSVPPAGGRESRPTRGADPLRGATESQVREKLNRPAPPAGDVEGVKEAPEDADRQRRFRERSQAERPPRAEPRSDPAPGQEGKNDAPRDTRETGGPGPAGDAGEKKRRRRRRGRRGGGESGGGAFGGAGGNPFH